MSGYTLSATPTEFAPDTVAHACGVTGWGADETAPDGTTRTLCECGHPTEAEAIACATPRSTSGLARAAFEAYGASTGGLTYDKKPIPPFDVIREKTPHVAAAWEAAANAVRKLVKP